MKTIYVNSLEKNQIIRNETFLIVSSEKSDDKHGRAYFKLTLGDKTGKVDGKIWSDNLINIDEKILKNGNLIQVSAKVDEYKGQFQLNIMSASKVDDSQIEDFVESSIFKTEDMVAELESFIGKIENKEISAIINKILSDKEIKRRFIYWPAATVVHHNFRSGLLQHVIEMLNISESMRRFYPEADFDVLIAGIILHDIGKIYELDGNDLSVPYTKKGILFGHINMSLQLFEDFGGRELQEDTYLHIAHLILSHHGTYEFGSPVLPSTVEAVMLTYIDDLSAKPRTADSIRKRIGGDEEFSQRVMWLENAKIWRATKNGSEKAGLDIPENVSDVSDIAEQLEL